MTLGASIITRTEPQLAEQVEGAYLSAVSGISQGKRKLRSTEIWCGFVFSSPFH
jgi:hypothetical protein